MKILLTGAIAALSVVAGVPGVAAPAFVAADLDLRAGPGLDYAVIGTLAARQSAEVEACVADGPWCRIRAGEESGWAHRGALSASDKLHVPVRAATIARRAGPEAGSAAGTGITAMAPREPDPLIEISDEAISLYFSGRTGAVSRPGEGIGGPEEGAGLIGAPIPRLTLSAVEGGTPDVETGGFETGGVRTVFNSR